MKQPKFKKGDKVSVTVKEETFDTEVINCFPCQFGHNHTPIVKKVEYIQYSYQLSFRKSQRFNEEDLTAMTSTKSTTKKSD